MFTYPVFRSRVTGEYRGEEAIGQAEYDDLVMEREFQADDDQLWSRRSAALEGQGNEALRTVTLQNDQGQAQPEWEFTDARGREYGTLECEGGD